MEDGSAIQTKSNICSTVLCIATAVVLYANENYPLSQVCGTHAPLSKHSSLYELMSRLARVSIMQYAH